jgi:hypothetical protein
MTYNLTQISSFLLASLLSCQTPQVRFGPIFNGKDLAGWKHVGKGTFVVENGLLKTVGRMGLLCYAREKVGYAIIRVVYKTTSRTSNSGVFVRIPDVPTEPWMPVNKGYEVQIDDDADEYHVSGVLYSLTRTPYRPGMPGQWNTLEITLDTNRTLVVLNGVTTTDYLEGQPVPPKTETWEPDRGPRPQVGYIGLQNHSVADTVFFKEISLRPIR